MTDHTDPYGVAAFAAKHARATRTPGHAMTRADHDAEALRRIKAPPMQPLFHADPNCPNCDGSSISGDGTYSRCYCAVPVGVN